MGGHIQDIQAYSGHAVHMAAVLTGYRKSLVGTSPISLIIMSQTGVETAWTW